MKSIPFSISAFCVLTFWESSVGRLKALISMLTVRCIFQLRTDSRSRKCRCLTVDKRFRVGRGADTRHAVTSHLLSGLTYRAEECSDYFKGVQSDYRTTVAS